MTTAKEKSLAKGYLSDLKAAMIAKNAMKKMDSDENGAVSVSELTVAVAKMIKIPENLAMKQAEEVMKAYDPQSDGALGPLEMAAFINGAPPIGMKRLENEVTAKSATRGLAKSKTKAQTILDLRKEIADRDKELLAREMRIGDFSTEVRNIQELLSADTAELKTKIPFNERDRQAMLKKLSEKVMYRAEKLDVLVAREKAWLKRKSKVKAPSAHKDSMALLMDIKKKSADVQAKVDLLLRQSESLKDELSKDVELQYEINKLTAAGSKLSVVMKEVSDDEKVMSAGSAEEKAEAEKKLLGDLENLNKDMEDMRRDSSRIDQNVVPRGDKWWRYHWEYSFVESILLIILVIIILIWEGVHKLLRRAVKRRSMLSPFYMVEDETTLYTSWWHYMMGEMFVILLVAMSLAILARLGFFDLVLFTQSSSRPDFHLPTTTKMYMREAMEILLQLGMALIIFFGLVLMIVVTCVNRECEWNMFEVEGGAVARNSLSAEAQLEIDEAGGIAPVSRVRASDMARLACGAQELLSLKMLFFAGANSCEAFATAMDGVPQHKFHFWHYLSMTARTGVESVYEISIVTWCIFLCCLAFFAVCYRFFEIAFVHVMVIMAIFMLLVLAYMWWYVRREVSLVDLHGNLETIPRQQHEPRRRWMSAETTVGLMIQFPTFFMSYSLSRLICSSWTWIYYPRTALCCTVVGISFFFLYRLIIAPVAITFFVVTSLPPHMDQSHIRMVARTAAYSAEQVKLSERPTGSVSRSSRGGRRRSLW